MEFRRSAVYNMRMPDKRQLPNLNRRDFLKAGALGLVGYSVIKAGLSYSASAKGQATTRVLTATQAQTMRYAALRLNGQASEASLNDGIWDPVATLDEMLVSMPSDQASLIAVGLSIFEYGRLGPAPFSTLSADGQLAHLENFRMSSMGLKRGIWGILRAASSLAYCGSTAGWEALGYPGPCIPTSDHPGRAPGQTTAYVWDERVP